MPSAPFWVNMSNADLVRLFYLSTHMLYERSTLCYSNGRMLTADSLPEDADLREHLQKVP